MSDQPWWKQLLPATPAVRLLAIIFLIIYAGVGILSILSVIYGATVASAMVMSLISLIVVLALIGVALWFVNTQITIIDPKIKNIINIVVVMAVILWLLSVFGLLNSISAVHVGRGSR